MKKINYLIIFFLIIGVVYRLLLTANGNFLFNMDNARDLVDVREMVVLQKPRLIGHTAAIEGVFYGPYWYYLSGVPFVLTQGNPYGSILLLVLFWAIGGFFALILAKRYGILAMILVGSLWVASNVLVLATSYSFNPNPAMLLTPLFIFLFDRYLTSKKTLYGILTFGLAAMFFSFELMFAVLVPVIILLTILLTRNWKLFKTKSLWFGVLTYILVLAPYLLFEVKHEFFMTNSLIRYLTNVESGGEPVIVNPIDRFGYILKLFYEMLLPTFMNFKFFTVGILWLSAAVIIRLVLKKEIFKDNVVTILLLYIFVTLIGYTLIPTVINSWHWVGVVAASIMLAGFMISQGMKMGMLGKFVAVILFVAGVGFSVMNLAEYFVKPRVQSMDPSLYQNELNAVDYVYKKADGKNFKVYVYMPSVIDYPYQYLFWWRGLNKYGYVPEDYAYEPNQFPYISQKEKLPTGSNPPSSGLIFLVKEPDRIGYRDAWDDHFKSHELITSEMVGPLEVEVRKETVAKSSANTK